MNFTQFLNTVDSVATQLSKKQLEGFVHYIARSLPESKREDFLIRLQELGGISAEARNILPAVLDENHIQKRLKNIREELLQIEKGELYLIGNLNEEYDDWYFEEGNEFLFEDPQDMAGIIEKACLLVRQGIESEFYKECYEIIEVLLNLEVRVEGDYGDYQEPVLHLKEIKENDLSTFDYRRLILDLLCSIYWITPMAERPRVIFQVISDYQSSDITLEAVMQTGKRELEQIPVFLNLWIAYLGEQKGVQAEKLLIEAVSLLNDSGQLLEIAGKFAEQHPILYYHILKGNDLNKSDESLLEIGQAALLAIPHQFRVHSQVALLTAEKASVLNRQKEVEQCWLEAFRSDTTPVNYLRMAVECTDFCCYRDEAQTIYRDCYMHSKSKNINIYHFDKSGENNISSNTYFALSFFGGEFSHVASKGMGKEESLGWSDTFMKAGIALFLLYLFQGNELTTGCSTMCNRVVYSIDFSKEEYSKGLCRTIDLDNAALFWNVFKQWKKSMSMKVEVEQQMLGKIEMWIRMRVEGIMKGNHRSRYNECAVFIAALGEVRASRGEVKGKEIFMQSYRAAYPRRSAFHRELRAFGMRGR